MTRSLLTASVGPDTPLRQAPISGPPAKTFAKMLAIVTHPAFRIGFLDAQAGRPLDHDKIHDRIASETPAKALTGWSPEIDRLLFEEFGLSEQPSSLLEVEISQYRYEEGRLMVVHAGLRCRAWGWPCHPPAQVMRFILERSARLEVAG